LSANRKLSRNGLLGSDLHSCGPAAGTLRKTADRSWLA